MLERWADRLWNPWMLGLFLLVGLWCSAESGFFQIFGIKTWLRGSLGTLFRKKKKAASGGLTQFQALSTALASTIGTGSIAGVATAIFFGGPGAVFWMWISALLGLMTSFAEKTLAVKYPAKSPGGRLGGRSHGLHGAGAGLERRREVVFLLVCSGGAGRGRYGPVQFHRFRPPCCAGLGAAGGGGGDGPVHRGGHPGGDRPGGTGE